MWKLKEVKVGNVDMFFSLIFMISKYGYCFCVFVCLNGDGKGKGIYMLVFISVLKGEKIKEKN